MTKVFELSPEWETWVASRPPVIQDLCRRLPPNRLYRLKSTGHRVMIHSFNENGTCAVLVLGKYNRVTFERCVFGIEPADLEECGLPEPGEPLGALMTDSEDVDLAIAASIAELHDKGEPHNEARCPRCLESRKP